MSSHRGAVVESDQDPLDSLRKSVRWWKKITYMAMATALLQSVVVLSSFLQIKELRKEIIDSVHLKEQWPEINVKMNALDHKLI